MLREWELWHTYTSAYVATLPDLEIVARNLVKWGVADCAVTSDGSAFWYNVPGAPIVGAEDNQVQEAASASHSSKRADERAVIGSGTVVLEPTHNKEMARIHFPIGMSNWILEIIGSWAQTRLAELRLFGESRLPPPYVWAQLGACSFVANDARRYQYVVYPVIKIFETGVVLVQFRMISPERPVHVDEYIRHYLNASLRPFRWVSVPPGIAAWAPMAVPSENMFKAWRLPWTAFSQWFHQRQIRRRVFTFVSGEFSFEQATMVGNADQQLLDTVTSEAQPEIERIVREATIAAAAAQGIHINEEFEVAGVDRAVQAELFKEAGVGGEMAAAAVPDRVGGKGEGEPPDASTQAAELEISDNSPPESFAVDWERFEQEALRASETGARRAGRILTKRALASSGPGSETFSSLAVTIMKVASHVVGSSGSGPRRGIRLALLGPGKLNDIIDHWAGRPHSHVFRFRHQSPSARENERRYRDDFASILSRVPLPSPPPPAFNLPESSRPFDDFGAYIGSSGSLWVHAYGGDRRRGGAPAERIQQIRVHDHQAKVELLEYGYALHRLIADRALNQGVADERSVERLLDSQVVLAEFEWAVQDTGSFGEIRDMLEHGWNRYGVPKIRKRVEQILELRQELASQKRHASNAKWTSFIALAAGILAVPPFVDVLLRPMWTLLSWPRPATDAAFTLLLTGVALGTVGAALYLGYIWSRPRA